MCPKDDQAQCLRLVEELESDAIDWSAVAAAWAVERGCGALEDAALVWRGRPEVAAEAGQPPPQASWFIAWPRRPGVEVACRPRPISVSILLRVPADIGLAPAAPGAGEGPAASRGGAGSGERELGGDGGGLPFGGLHEDGVHPCGGLLGDDLDEWSPTDVPDGFPSTPGVTGAGPSTAGRAAPRSHRQTPLDWAGRPGWRVSSSPSPSPSWEDEAGGEWGAAAAARAGGDDEDDDVEPAAPAPPPDLFCADLGPLEMWAGPGAGPGRGGADCGGASLAAAVAAAAAAAASFDDDLSAPPPDCLLAMEGAALAEVE
jgi:hypothetical protein